MEAHTLSLNDFNMPLVFKGNNAAYVNIIRLIELEKGTFQSHPDMGVGIHSRYRFNNDENVLQNLQHDIQNQIERFLPQLSATDIRCTLKDGILSITIDTVNGVYAIDYNQATDTVAPATYSLGEL